MLDMLELKDPPLAPYSNECEFETSTHILETIDRVPGTEFTTRPQETHYVQAGVIKGYTFD